MRIMRWKIPILMFLMAGLVAMAVLVGGGWYVADILKNEGLLPDHEEPKLDMVVASIGEGQVTLNVTSDTSTDGPWMRRGIWGLKSADGYDQVGAILEISDQHVVREYLPLKGILSTGESVHVEGTAFPGDPREAFGFTFENVTFSSRLGDFDAWFVDGSSNTWVIFVHGRGSKRNEALRILPTIVESGLPFLIITYRNDEGAPADPDGYYRYGQTEWEDLEGAVAYSVAQGAEDLILVGYSMGGSIVTNFLYQSPLAKRVRGLILDAPMINFNATVELGANERSLPGPFVDLAKFIAKVRFGIDWGDLDYLARATELGPPILLFHGDIDDLVPIETSDALAKARPDIVEYVRVPGAPHVGSWNIDHVRYETAVSDFLRDITR